MLQAYVDDSASDQGDQRLFLAGYINAADRWIRSSDAWAEVLRDPPAIGYLKMSEANRFQNTGGSSPSTQGSVEKNIPGHGEA